MKVWKLQLSNLKEKRTVTFSLCIAHHDLHATILHLMGLDHERLTFRYNSRDFRLSDVYGNVVHEVIA